jgi:4-amino-4-deoxy-L-arabinose transferase-like glycosyltransferase
MAKEGWIAAIVLATSVGFVLIGRVIIFDMVLTAVFSLSLIFFYLWYLYEKKHYLWLSYLFLGLAFMTKGMLSVALIPAIAFLFMFFNKTPWKKIFKLFDVVGISIFLLVTVPWVIAATIQQHDFAWDFFINEQVMRFLNKRVPHDYHTGHIYYYIIPLIVSMMPWSFTFPLLFKKDKHPTTRQKIVEKFLWLWFLLPFIFFSISDAKAQYYIVIGYSCWHC